MNQFELTESILTYRKENNSFRKSIQTRSDKMQWKFYDGPPFTSGDPHYGHLLQSTVKDMVPRRMTMRGYRVERKRWWDCHGIPAENFVNKKLGITSKKEVEEEFGLQKYVEECRTMVWDVNDNRKRFVDHLGRWVDMENAYFTMNNEFMESVIHLFADLYHNNLIYKWFKVLGYSRALGTALSNSEIAEGYMDRQDPAVTVKLKLKAKSWKLKAECETTEDGFGEVTLWLLRDGDKILMVYDTRSGKWFIPGWKVDAGETLEESVKRELFEEIWITVTSTKLLWKTKVPHHSKLRRLNCLECEYTGEFENKEPEKQWAIAWISKIEADNELWYAIKIEPIWEESSIIDDPDQFQYDFADMLMITEWKYNTDMEEAPVSMLAWTTTPWTLPSNMFGAVNNDIVYAVVFDKTEKEYYILAKSLLSNYYKNEDDYILTYQIKWSHFVWLDYEPLFDYYYKAPDIDPSYHDKVHKILHADFVTEDSGTGIAHEAPAFGEDDYGLVTSLSSENDIIDFPPEKANEWLFNPVDDHGEFTADVSDFVGMNVIESNKEVIKSLKDRWVLVKQETINHSYPHCPRTKEPIIYRAMESWFVKEKELTAKTLPLAEQINFVPETIKTRFTNWLASAPDWNISRTRFRWAPLPVRECEKEDCEERKVFGSIADIADASWQEVTDLHRPYIDEVTIPCTCGGVMRRIPEVLDCWFESGSMPYGQSHFMKNNNWQEKIVDTIWFDEHEEMLVLNNEKTKTYRLSKKYFGKVKTWDILNVENTRSKTIIWSIEITNITLIKFNDIPLATAWHLPYYSSEEDKKIRFRKYYNRDIWDNEDVAVVEFKLVKSNNEINNTNFSTTADFIAEWLDQTRGWFRSLHVLGAAYTDNIVYKNVVITWMILAEDGKKMSKSLKNYPDPRWLFEKYGADAFRLYVLWSPVVRAEPLRFAEQWVEQVLKDFVIPLQNVWNFFETYASVDEWKDDGTEVYFMRHADKEESWKMENKETPLSDEWFAQIQSKDFVERVLRIDPEVIITTNRLRAIQTAEWAQKIMQDYIWKKIDVIQRDNLVDGFDKESCEKIYQDLVKEFSWKRVLIVSHRWRFLYLWNSLFGTSFEHLDKDGVYGLWSTEITKLPTTEIHNELDQRILSELYSMMSQLDTDLQWYELEPATKTLMWFMDKLTNRWLRRSRRRFWAEWMDDDKQAVYWTLWEVLSIYLKLAAPFAPFVTEWVWQQMQAFKAKNWKLKAESIHLEHRPLLSEKYINQELSDEIAQVRKIIKGAMYLRAKHQIKVKQPLQELKFRF